MQVEVTDADRELFIQINEVKDFDDVAVRNVKEGRWFTWEVEQIARHRIAERERVVGEIVAWLATKDNYDFDDLAIDIEAKFGARDVAD